MSAREVVGWAALVAWILWGIYMVSVPRRDDPLWRDVIGIGLWGIVLWGLWGVS